MCGIAGWFGPGPEQAELELRAMVERIVHRGPDGLGFWLDPAAALGHARLSIIDLDGGRQPLWNLERSAVIAFNGEIYNHRQIRAELAQSGVRFQTRSDTEVLLNAFLTWGVPGLARLRGMYAFAIWDQRGQRGILGRDPSGIKPLFIRTHGQRLLFASEAKAFGGTNASLSLDEASVHLMMNFRYLPGRRSMFSGVEQLAPGEVLSWRAGQVSRERIPAPQARFDQSIPQLLKTSVELHLEADVEVGAYLSGGIDSALVCALSGRALRTFTLDVGDDPDEAVNAARSAELLGMENIVGQAGAPSRDELRRLIWHLEVPKINAVQLLRLATIARSSVKAVLSGVGGDELFLGYNLHQLIRRSQMLATAVPGGLRRLLGAAGGRWGRSSLAPWTEIERAGELLGAIPDWPKVYALIRNVWDRPELRTQIYGPRMLDQVDLPDAVEVIRQGWNPDRGSGLASAADFERREKLVNDLMWNEDRCSMAVGLEVRTPLVDRHLTSELSRYTPEQLMPGGRLKGLLKDSLQPVLPAEIMNRPKSGFQVDAPEYFRSQLMSHANDLLAPNRVREIGLFSNSFVQGLLKLPAEKKWRWHYFILYQILLTHIWVEVFESNDGSFGSAH